MTNFWGDISIRGDIFPVQEKIVRITVGQHIRASCASLYKKLEILLDTCQYRPILSLMNLVFNNQGNVQTKSSVHNISTQSKHNFHRPNINLSSFQKSTFCAGIRIFNSWPCNLTFLKNEKTKFKVALKKYLNTHCLYSVDEFCMCKGDPVFFKMFIVFYIVNILIICILMTCSTSCCLCKHWSMECTYVCMHVCRSKTVSCNNQTAFH